MAQLKDLIVSGAARVQGTVYADSFADGSGSDISGTYIKSLKIDTNDKLVAVKGDNTEMTGITLPIPTISAATDQAAGITKIYSSIGNNTDGTMTQAAITTAIGNINQFSIEVVNSLPTQDIDDHTIYLVPNSGSGTNVKDEYLYVNNNWEKIGTTDIDLSPYVTSTDLADLPYVSSVSQSGNTITVTTNDDTTPTTNTVSSGVMSVTAGTGLTGGTISDTGTIALDASGATAGTYGPSAAVTGTEGTTINVPELTVDSYGRVTSISNKVYTSKDTTYTPASLGSGYAVCSTAAATVAKEITITGYELVSGGVIVVNFTNDVPAAATLNVSNKGALPIYYNGAAIVTDIITAGSICTFMCDGSHYHLLTIDQYLNEATNDYGNPDEWGA